MAGEVIDIYLYIVYYEEEPIAGEVIDIYLDGVVRRRAHRRGGRNTWTRRTEGKSSSQVGTLD